MVRAFLAATSVANPFLILTASALRAQVPYTLNPFGDVHQQPGQPS